MRTIRILLAVLWLAAINGCDLYDYSDLECGEGEVVDEDVTITNAHELNDVAGANSITGELVINGTWVSSFEGLKCLEEVGERLYIVNNHEITDLDGLALRIPHDVRRLPDHPRQPGATRLSSRRIAGGGGRARMVRLGEHRGK